MSVSALTAPVPNDATFLGLNEVSAVLLTAGIAGLIAIWAIFSQRKITAQQITFQYLTASEGDEDRIKARREFNRLAKEDEGLGKYARDAHINSEEARLIRMVLNEHELIAIALQRGILDDTTYRRFFRSGALRTWEHAVPYVMLRRTLGQQPLLYHEFEELARWYRDTPKVPRRWFVWRFFP